MNCKPGELAIVINGWFVENIGAIVECGDFFTDEYGEVWFEVVSTGRKLTYSKWDSPSYQRDGVDTELCIEDRCMRPIRDQDGEDEILRIAGKPVREAA